MNAQLPPASFIPPEVAELAALFPAYEISHLIATGGMGAVYCATQKSLDRTVAIKILPRELTADAAFREGFVAEAKAMARLNHPNLIGVYDFGEVAGMLYIIMEFVPCQSLFHSAHGLAIDPLETIRLVSSIYQSQVKGLVRKVKDKKIRGQLDTALEDFIGNCRDNHNTLPENPEAMIATQISIDSCHLQACQTQKNHDAALGESLGQWSALYIVGLEKQMDRLKAAKDTAAAALLQQEIDATRSSKSYFADLILK